MNQKALIPEPGTVVIQDEAMPKPKPDEALVRVLYGGICGSDIGTYRGTFVYSTYPRIPGHELAVEVMEVGDNPYGVKPGMLATVNPYFNCGHCYPCRSGRPNCCVANETMGAQREGGFMRYLALPVERLYGSRGLGPRETVLVEPFCISWHGVKRAAVQPGEKVLVIGAGTIGVLAMLSAKYQGCEVYMTDVAPAKLERAKQLGADGVFLNTSPEALADWTARVTGGDGFPVTLEAVGMPGTFQNAIDAASSSGRVVLVGISRAPLSEFTFTIIQKKELSVYGSRNAVHQDFHEVMDMMRKSGLKADDVVTDIYRFSQTPQAFSDFVSRGADKLKVLVDFSE